MDPWPVQTLGGLAPSAAPTARPSPQPEEAQQDGATWGSLGVGQAVGLGVAH